MTMFSASDDDGTTEVKQRVRQRLQFSDGEPFIDASVGKPVLVTTCELPVLDGLTVTVPALEMLGEPRPGDGVMYVCFGCEGRLLITLPLLPESPAVAWFQGLAEKVKLGQAVEFVFRNHPEGARA